MLFCNQYFGQFLSLSHRKRSIAQVNTHTLPERRSAIFWDLCPKHSLHCSPTHQSSLAPKSESAV
ncbi:MAG: hypothetical protein ACK5CM_08020, partial [Pseudanabaena sp.]